MKIGNAQPSQRRPRAFMLVELIVVTILLASFSLLAADLFTLSLRAQTSGAQRETLIHRVDDSMAYLRKDVWSSTGLIATETELQIIGPQGEHIVWSWSSSAEESQQWSGRGRLVRVRTGPSTGGPAGRTEYTWIQMPQAKFTVKGPLVTTHFAATPGIAEPLSSGRLTGGGQNEEQAVMVSQRLLANANAGGQP